MRAQRTWFDSEHLLAGEEIDREARAWLRTDLAPNWWEGTLVLTTDRLFFLPEVYNPLIGDVAFWLSDLTGISNPRRDRLSVTAPDRAVLFELPGTVAKALAHARQWARRIEELRPDARRREAPAAGIRRAG